MISFVFVGVLVVLDVLFFINYIAVRWIRAWTNQREEELEAADQASANAIPRNRTSSSGCLPDKPSLPSAATEYIQAFFMNVVHREPTSVMTFEKWRDLPYACGKWSTVALVLLCMSLVSIEFKVGAKDRVPAMRGVVEPYTCTNPRIVSVIARCGRFLSLIHSHFARRVMTQLPVECRLLQDLFVWQLILLVKSIDLSQNLAR